MVSSRPARTKWAKQPGQGVIQAELVAIEICCGLLQTGAGYVVLNKGANSGGERRDISSRGEEDSFRLSPRRLG